MADAAFSPQEKLGRRLFTAGAVFLILLGAVHSLSLIERLKPQNDSERQLVDLMTSYKFNRMGSLRSMDNLMTGFSVAFLLSALVLGRLGVILRRERSGLLKRVALAVTLWLAALSAVSIHYFFPAPTSFLLLSFALFFFSWLTLPVLPSSPGP